MKINKLPSGNYNARVRINGKICSFTAESERKVERLVREAYNTQKRRETSGMTVEEAVRNFIESRRHVASPSTIASYEKWLKDRFIDLHSIPVGKVTSLVLQDAIDAECAKKTYKGEKIAPKTVINAYGMYRSAIARAVGDEYFNPKVRLPKEVKKYKDLPTPKEVIEAVKGSDIELPVLLAMWMSLTESEIRGIKVSSIRDGVLYIEEAVVQINGVPVHKEAAKAYDRNRKNRIPPYIMKLIEKTDAWKAGEGYIETRSGNALYKRFQRVLADKDVKPMRFHELRHLFASVGLQLGIPEKYLMEKGGWSTPHIMRSVYQHTFTSEMDYFTSQIDNYFESLIG
jgi:integrase